MRRVPVVNKGYNCLVYESKVRTGESSSTSEIGICETNETNFDVQED